MERKSSWGAQHQSTIKEAPETRRLAAGGEEMRASSLRLLRSKHLFFLPPTRRQKHNCPLLVERPPPHLLPSGKPHQRPGPPRLTGPWVADGCRKRRHRKGGRNALIHSLKRCVLTQVNLLSQGLAGKKHTTFFTHYPFPRQTRWLSEKRLAVGKGVESEGKEKRAQPPPSPQQPQCRQLRRQARLQGTLCSRRWRRPRPGSRLARPGTRARPRGR